MPNVMEGSYPCIGPGKECRSARHMEIRSKVGLDCQKVSTSIFHDDGLESSFVSCVDILKQKAVSRTGAIAFLDP